MKKHEIIDILLKMNSDEVSENEIHNIFSSDDNFKDEFKIDTTRNKRCGFPEFIYGASKSNEQLITVINKLFELNEPILVTRITEERYYAIKEMLPINIKYDSVAKVIYYFNFEKKTSYKKNFKVAIISAGTSDIPIAMEAKYVIEICGYDADLIFDIGVAGIHRLMDKIEKIRLSDVAIVIAGMEGALPSVIAGLVSIPVIAVPTSVGYGAALNGFTPLFAMLTSCASGITVTNIDNGFGAGCAAVRILNTFSSKKL